MQKLEPKYLLVIFCCWIVFLYVRHYGDTEFCETLEFIWIALKKLNLTNNPFEKQMHCKSPSQVDDISIQS